jgi:hypothetical protein
LGIVLSDKDNELHVPYQGCYCRATLMPVLSGNLIRAVTAVHDANLFGLSFFTSGEQLVLLEMLCQSLQMLLKGRRLGCKMSELRSIQHAKHFRPSAFNTN